MADHPIPVEIEAKLLVPTATDLRATQSPPAPEPATTAAQGGTS